MSKKIPILQFKKRCSKCKKWLHISQFLRKNDRPGGRQSWCRNCTRERWKVWANLNRSVYLLSMKKSKLKTNHKMSWDFYLFTLKKQKNRCACCGSKKPGGHGRWHVDHDHRCCKTKNKSCRKCVRALLCSRCNIVLGYVKDSIKILRALICYLKKY